MIIGREIAYGANDGIHLMRFDGSRYLSTCREHLGMRMLNKNISDVTCVRCVKIGAKDA